MLRQGIRREHVFAVAAICALSDLALIMVGVSGIGAVLQAVPWLVEVIRWAGAAFLVVYGLLAARRAIRPSGEALVVGDGGADAATSDAGPDARGIRRPGHPPARGARGSRRRGIRDRDARAPRRTTLLAAVLTCLALTWLNPHVYLDTVFLLGSVANTHGDGRWAFAVGAGVASIVVVLRPRLRRAAPRRRAREPARVARARRRDRRRDDRPRRLARAAALTLPARSCQCRFRRAAASARKPVEEIRGTPR